MSNIAGTLSNSPDSLQRPVSSLSPPPTPTLQFDALEVAYTVRGIDRMVLREVSFCVAPGEAYGLVGESGCGKSTAAFAAMRYLPRNGKVVGGRILFEGQDLLALPNESIRALRSSAMSMVYQSPIAALNPSLRVGRQVAEVFTIAGHNKRDAADMAAQALATVQIADVSKVMERYPHELSGGMAQRVVIAMALAINPRLLILDEPTTGLDATVEAEVLDLVRTLRSETNAAVLFISHNLGVIRSMCDRVGVLYAGQLVEEGATSELLGDPRHPYTVGLLRCIPRAGLRKDVHRLDTIPGTLPPLGQVMPGCVYVDRCPIATDICRTEKPPVVELLNGQTTRCFHHELAPALPRIEQSEVSNGSLDKANLDHDEFLFLRVNKTFGSNDENIRVLTDVSLSLQPGETLGLVGESGSGKTTLAKLMLGLIPPDAGSVIALDGKTLGPVLGDRAASEVGAIQIVFQNPDSALNRRHTVRRIVGRAVQKLSGVSKLEAAARSEDLLSSMRVDARLHAAKPAMLSGGLKQRVAIARAFAGKPRLVVCDEPTSALDVSVQAAILNLLVDLQRNESVSYLFISHDLGVVRYISDRIAVLYLGRVMELGNAETVFAGPHHPYTEALVSSLPSVDGEASNRVRLVGEVPSVAKPPLGCVLHTRCPRRAGSGVEDLCSTLEPDLVEVEPGHLMRCHISLEQLRKMQTALDDAALV
jgi:peptide/nickel transport system ATP-binding protein